MRPRRILTLADAAEILGQAARDSALAVVTLHADAGWKSLKSRFLERDPQQRFFVLDYLAFNGQQLPTLHPGQYVGVSFRRKSRKVLFSTVVQATGHYLLNDQQSVPAVRYRWPAHMTELQRRAYYRTPVPGGVNLLVNLWQGGRQARHAAQARTLHVLTGNAADISCGGALVRLNQPAPPNWPLDETLGVEAHLPDGRAPIQSDAFYRGLRHDAAGNLCLAIQFVGLEMVPGGQSALRRITHCVQQFNRATFGSAPPPRRPRAPG